MSNDADKKVGYKNPPKETRFQKGKTGNPKGRPKSISISERLIKELNSKIEIKEGGIQKSMSRLEAYFKNLIAKSITTGDLRLLQTLLRHGLFFGIDPMEKQIPPVNILLSFVEPIETLEDPLLIDGLGEAKKNKNE